MSANVTLVQSLYAAFGRGDVAAIAAVTAPDATWEAVGRPEDCPWLGVRKGPAGVREFFCVLAENQEIIAFSPNEFYAADDKVFVMGDYSWTMRKTGKSGSSPWIHVFTIRNGKVTGFRDFLDTAHLAETLRA